MSKAKARVFVPLTKVDEEQRLVYGRITQEMLDKSKEVMDYDSSVPFFKQWSEEISANSGGLSKGNVRVMHGLTAAGKLTELDFNDVEKAIDVCAKVVDDAEWIKVTEGVYTGFSVGGAYEKRWTDTVDGEKIKKFTARPNEVSLVDNPCVPSATFSMFKADGAEEQVAFAVKNDDAEWPGFAKADGEPTEKEVAEEQAEAEPEQLELSLPTNDQVVEKATQMAKAAGEATKTWMDFVPQARDELVKAATDAKKGKKKDDAEDKADGGADEDEEDAKDSKAEKVTPAGVKQVWTASDGTTFGKKDEAIAHEATLKKAEPTEAEKLKARLSKALAPEDETTVDLMEDYDRLGKVIQALATPFENGAPKLEKGMYTVSRFANTLWDMGSLTRCIKAEGKREGDDKADDAVSSEMQKALSVFAGSFKAYVDNQVTELLAGIDDELCVATYDYYYAAAKADPEDQLAKDVCSVISDRRDASREVRETLTKSFGYVEAQLDSTDEMNPTMKKRFDTMEAENGELKKIASDAIEAVEKLTKRVDEIAEQPLPRAPRNPAFLPGDNSFFGKKVNSEEERIEVLKGMLETHGADGLATMMIKASHATGGQQLHLKQ